MPVALKVAALVLMALVLNLPLGYWRAGTRKFSPAWFFFIHASIPVIIWARMSLGLSAWYIPFSLGSAVVGQLLGAKLRR